MAKIDFEKFICSLLNDADNKNFPLEGEDLVEALRDQGLEYVNGKIVEISGNDGGISPNPDFKIEKGKWYMCIKSFSNLFIEGKVYKSYDTNSLMTSG